jgi:hypothetical protein
LKIYIIVGNSETDCYRIQYFGADNSGDNIYFNIGKVEIGNNSPSYDLNITGNINVTGNLTSNNKLLI